MTAADEVLLRLSGQPPGGPPEVGARILVAGVGNIFLGDDGFGVEVARALAAELGLGGAKITDFGIRGVHLAYELLEGYETVILIDAVARGDAPGTVSVIEPEAEALRDGERGAGALAAMDAHGMNPAAVLAMVADLGGQLNRVLVVGCEPAQVSDGIGLSEAVAAAVPVAVGVVRELIAEASTVDATD